MAGKAPVMKLEAFPLQAAVWENEHTSNGRTWKSYSVKLTKSFKEEKTGKWQSTEFLSDRDLLAAAALLTEVYRTIAIKEGKVAAPKQSTDDDGESYDPGPHPF